MSASFAGGLPLFVRVKLLAGGAGIAWILATLLTIHAGLLAYSGYVHSPTMDEPAHLVAGISHWQFGSFQLYQVNPPLVRMVAALPVLAVGVTTDWTNFRVAPGLRPVHGMGNDLIVANGARSFRLFMIARWACIPFSLIGAMGCFLWGRDLYGPKAGLLSATLWCFSPSVIAHASLISADAPAAALGLCAGYAFWRWLQQPSWKTAALAGAVLGASQLTKSTLILFFPLWPVLWILYRLPDRARMRGRDWLREGAMLATCMAIAIYFLNLGYGFEGTFTRLRDFQFVSNSFTGEPSGQVGNRFSRSPLGALPVPLPKQYVLGIDIQRGDFESYQSLSYLRGQFQDGGWWYYYFYGLAIKEPLGTWILLLLAIVLGVTWPRLGPSGTRREELGTDPSAADPPGYRAASRRGDAAPTAFRDELILLLPAILTFVAVSSQTGFSKHLRYVLPCVPYVFVWVGAIAQLLDKPMPRITITAGRHSPFVRGLAARKWQLATGVVIVALTWSVVSSLWIYPHSLSYFNEFVGGPEHGHEHLLGSNVDWGQDLRYFAWWQEEHPEAKPLYLMYQCFDSNDVGVCVPPPPKAWDSTDLRNYQPGWYAVGINSLFTDAWIASGRGRRGRGFGTPSPLLSLEPNARAGYSIVIYHLEDVPTGVGMAATENEK